MGPLVADGDVPGSCGGSIGLVVVVVAAVVVLLCGLTLAVLGVVSRGRLGGDGGVEGCRVATTVGFIAGSLLPSILMTGAWHSAEEVVTEAGGTTSV